MLGAGSIFVTVGSEEKAEYLVNHHGIRKDHIFNSRDDSFYTRLMDATNNLGVDLVLNSLSGDLLQASWRCVAKWGSMVEIGKRDMIERGQLPLNGFLDNRTFHGIDIRILTTERPRLVQQ